MSTRMLHFTLILLTQFALFSLPAQSASKTKPVIDSFEVEQVEELSPGTDLSFSLQGTPGGTATVSINDGARTLTLVEVDDGLYEGDYTLRRSDKFTSKTIVRGRLKKGKLSTRVRLQVPLISTADSTSRRSRTDDRRLTIDAFTLRAVDQIEPGVELLFKLVGTPDARATVRIDGATDSLPMTETAEGSGVYEARYTIRRQDNFKSDMRITGTLGRGQDSVSTRLQQSTSSDEDRSRGISNFSPRNNETVSLSSGKEFFISASFDDSSGSALDTRSVRVLLDDRDVTNDSVITSNFFSYEPARRLDAGSHQVKVTAKDRKGDSLRAAWRFQIENSSGHSGSRLEILSPANNSEVSSSGPVEIRGKSRPDTDIAVDVQAVASLAGLFGVNQPVMNDTVRSDARGNFSFSFQPRFALPGTRYEVKLSVGQGEQIREEKLTLTTRK